MVGFERGTVSCANRETAMGRGGDGGRQMWRQRVGQKKREAEFQTKKNAAKTLREEEGEAEKEKRWKLKGRGK